MTALNPKGGIRAIVEMLHQMSPSEQKKLLSQIEEKDPALAQKIKASLFTFEDLFSLPEQHQVTLWNQISIDLLALAMRTLSQERKEKIYISLSKRKKTLLQETLSHMPPQALHKIEEAQKEILHIAQTLEQEGKISLSKTEKWIP